MGFCSGAGQPGWTNDNPGQERGCRGRGGHGHRNRYKATGLTGSQWAAQSADGKQPEPVLAATAGDTEPSANREQLQREAEALGTALQQIRQRIDALSAKGSVQ